MKTLDPINKAPSTLVLKCPQIAPKTLDFIGPLDPRPSSLKRREIAPSAKVQCCQPCAVNHSLITTPPKGALGVFFAKIRPCKIPDSDVERWLFGRSLLGGRM
jgi:hypothetical protein